MSFYCKARDKSIPFNLSNTADCKRYIDFLGGEEIVKSIAPTLFAKLCENVDNANSNDTAATNTDAAEIKANTHDFDLVDNGKLGFGTTFVSSYEYTAPAPRLFTAVGTEEVISANQSKSDVLSWTNLKISGGYYHIVERNLDGSIKKLGQIIGNDVGLNIDNANLSNSSFMKTVPGAGEVKNLDILAQFVLSGIDPDGNPRGLAYEAEFVCDTSEQPYIQSATVVDPYPRKQASRSGDQAHKILIGYDRSISTADYYFSTDGKTTSYCVGDKRFVTTVIPIKVKIELAPGMKYDGLQSVDTRMDYPRANAVFECPLTTSCKTLYHYHKLTDAEYRRKLLNAVSCTTSGNIDTVTFDLSLFNADAARYDADWFDDFELDGTAASVWSRNNLNNVALVIKLPMMIKDSLHPKQQAVAKNFSLQGVSKANLDELGTEYYKSANTDNNLMYIPLIEIWWGCFARETLIKLANGTEKRADKIEVGDTLIAKGGKALRVDGLTTGDDKTILEITADNGASIRISKGHPMITGGDTPLPAYKLKVGDELMLENGWAKILSIKEVEYNDTVYNFSFEGETEGNYVVANGFWSGDIYAQNHIKRKPQKQSDKISEDDLTLRKEMGALFQDDDIALRRASMLTAND